MLNPLKNQFVATHGSTLRAIFDFSNENNSLFILSTGQSGHFLSQHYDDQSVLWQQEQYITMQNNKTFLDGTVPKTVINPI
jgi:penicillin amidase